MNIIDVVKKDYVDSHTHEYPAFRPGDTVAVHVTIKEGAKSRVQVFQGICIAQKERESLHGHFRVRKICGGGYGVERVFPYYSPMITKIELKERGKSRRAKHFYLRERTGKKARIAIDYLRNE